jgi:hypothetical protein
MMYPQALVIFVDSAKHKTGRAGEFGAFRHRFVELYPIRGLTLLFFTYFHVLSMPVPSFEPNFSDPEHGEVGRRGWYEIFIFSTKTPQTSMSYESKLLCYPLSVIVY